MGNRARLSSNQIVMGIACAGFTALMMLILATLASST